MVGGGGLVTSQSPPPPHLFKVSLLMVTRAETDGSAFTLQLVLNTTPRRRP